MFHAKNKPNKEVKIHGSPSFKPLSMKMRGLDQMSTYNTNPLRVFPTSWSE